MGLIPQILSTASSTCALSPKGYKNSMMWQWHVYMSAGLSFRMLCDDSASGYIPVLRH